MSLRFPVLFAVLAVSATSALAQVGREPHIGYVYPAGARRGSSCELIIGGQTLRDAKQIIVSGGGVRAEVIRYYKPLNNIDQEERVALQRRMRDLFEKRAAELAGQGHTLPPFVREMFPAMKSPPASKPATPAKPAKKGDKPAPAASPDEAALPEHPLLRNLDQASLKDLIHIRDELLKFRTRQRNPQIAESVIVKITVEAGAAIGERDIRLLTPLGLTNPMRFEIGTSPEAAEQEPNEPQPRAFLPEDPPFELPMLVNGQVQPGDVLVLENTRFHKGETKNDMEIARQMASLADLYVNDAFGSAHRAHSSTEGVAHYLPAVAGFLMEKEIKYLGQAITDPKRPFVAILGGAKVSDKINVIRNLLQKADYVLIGGGMANTFFKAQGYPVGDSLVEDEALDTARELLGLGGQRLRLPVDAVIADRFEDGADRKVMAIGPIPDGWRIMDIGPETVAAYAKALHGAGTVVWNGPMGVFEFPRFAQGTFGVANAVAESNATSIVGGGDSVAAINQSGLADKITHISTGGGASLEMLEGLVLPCVAALQDK